MAPNFICRIQPSRASTVRPFSPDPSRLVNIRARFANPLSTPIDVVIEVPTQERNTTISSATAYLADGRAVDTQVVDTSEAAQQAPNEDMIRTAKEFSPDQATAYNPNSFRLPVAGVPAESEVAVDISYFQTLDFDKGEYKIVVPTKLPHAYMPASGNAVEVLRVDAAVNAGTSEASWGCASHPMQTKAGPPPAPVGTFVKPAYTTTVQLNGQTVTVQIPEQTFRHAAAEKRMEVGVPGFIGGGGGDAGAAPQGAAGGPSAVPGFGGGAPAPAPAPSAPSPAVQRQQQLA